jgi:hypothetical protein
MLQPDASPDLDARHSDGKSLLEVARLPALRLLLRDHAGSPMARLSRLVASGSMSARRAAARADGEPLLCAHAVLASPDGRSIVSAVTLGSAQLPHATCRLALGGGSPFAPVPVIESLRTFEQRLAGLSLAADAVHGGSTPERDGRHVAVEVLRDLLLVSPADWQPPTDRRRVCSAGHCMMRCSHVWSCGRFLSSFGVSADDIWLLCDAAEALFRAEPCVCALSLRAAHLFTPPSSPLQDRAAPAGAHEDIWRHARPIRRPDAPFHRLWRSQRHGRLVRY